MEFVEILGVMLMNATSSVFDVSVIIPVYKTKPDSLLRCIESVQKQTIHPSSLSVECLIIFDGCPDKVLKDIVNRFSDFVICITIPHAGVSAARNFGIESASGRWIVFLDSDDELEDSALSIFVTAGETTSSEIVQGAYISFLSSRVEKHEYCSVRSVFTGKQLDAFRQDVLVPDKGIGLVWSKAFLRSFLLGNRLRFDTSLSMGEDSIFVFDCLSYVNKVVGLSEFVYRYHRSVNSAVSKFRPDYDNQIMISLKTMKNRISRLDNADDYDCHFSDYVCFHLLLLQVHYIFNPNSVWTGKERRRIYKDILSVPLYRGALGKVNLSSFSLPKRISLLSLRYSLYFLSYIIALVRNNQI